jgi:maltooligosyltrehalose trehalohydrolase
MGEGVRFRVWAPAARQVEVVLFDAAGQAGAAHPLARDAAGYWDGQVAGLGAGARYMYRLDGEKLRPDPAGRYQPAGVHGPSQVVDPASAWGASAGWRGRPLAELVIYETHIGTATPEGTFDAFIEKLPYLQALGVTAIELMPVGDFPGEHNWGYDGVCLFAPARAYGGPDGLKRLVDAAHAQGLAVILDVVYNHLGPDGNYLRDFSPAYFTAAHHTPWGEALNFAHPEVRAFFFANAIYWAREYQVDGFRLDATHAIYDDSPEHFLGELPRRVRAALPADRHLVFIAEDERNEVRLITPPQAGGMGLDAVWADDFHHQVRAALAGDHEGYYADYTGSAADLAGTLRQGWFYVGQLSAYAARPRGTDASAFDPPHFVYCIQNHDQVGNRALGDRLHHGIGPGAYRAAAALLLLSPYTPLLFQGQEWAATTPFLFFTDHNPDLGRMVTAGRRAEFAPFAAFQGTEVPDPQAPTTFLASKLRWEELDRPAHRAVLTLYRELLALRRRLPALQGCSRARFESAQVDQDAIIMRYRTAGGENDVLVVINLTGDLRVALAAYKAARPPGGRRWRVALSTEEPRFGGAQEPAALQSALDADRLTASGPLTIALLAAT